MLRLDWKAHHVPRAQGCGAGTEAERAELCRLLRRRGVGQALAQRIRVVLACAEPSATNLGVAEALGVSRQTVATCGPVPL